ncbi:MAG: hypothetical protein PUJ60_03995 [bacterium]|nr:hypothetical protein [bacterium]MDY4108022.1 hypothetical protein [Bacilli bacterium]
MEKINGINKIKKIIRIIMLVVVALIAIYAIFVAIPSKKNKDEGIENINNKYILYKRDSSLYKENFEKLRTILETSPVDNKKYAETIVKLFVIDFYTLDNKNDNTDIGGLQYVHSNLKDNLVLNASSTMYKYINTTKELPKVKSITSVDTRETTYKINDNDYSAYAITINWEYDKDLGYEKQGTFIVVNDNGNLSIVEK